MSEKKESKGLGCFAKLIIIIIIIAILIYVGVKLFFPADRIKSEIVSRASAELGRTVELDDVSLSLFPGFTLDLKGLRIFSPPDFPGTEFVSIDRLSCGLKLMPLIGGRFEFDEIAIIHPVIHLRKTAEGRTNYSFESTAMVEQKSAAEPESERQEVTTKKAALSVFAFDWAEIKNGDLFFVDDSADLEFTLNNFSLETRLHTDADGKSGRSMGTIHLPSIKSSALPENLPLNLELAYNADIDYKQADIVFKNTNLTINGILFNIEATLRKVSDLQSVYVRLNAPRVPIAPLLDYIPSSDGEGEGAGFDRDQLRLNGMLAGEIEMRLEFGSGNEPYFGGSLKFIDITAGYANISGRAHFDTLLVRFNADSVVLNSFGGDLSGEPFNLDLVAKNWDDLQYGAHIKGSYSLAGILPFLDRSLGHEISGRAVFDLNLTGRKSDWVNSRLNGWAAINNLYYNNDSLTSPLNRLDLKISFGKRKVTIDSLYAEYPGVILNMTGTLKNGFAHLVEPRKGHKKPYIDFQLTSPLINYDILIPYDSAAEGVSSTAAGAANTGLGGAMAAPIFLPDIEAGGSVVIDTFIFREVEFTQLSMEVSYKDGIITYSNARGMVYSGNISSDGSVDINDMFEPIVSCDFVGNNIEANDFMAHFANLDGHLYGKLNLKGQMSGTGSEPETFIRSLNAEGDFNMGEGRIVNFDLINKLAKKLKFRTFEEEAVNDLAAKVKVEDGKLFLDGTRIFTGIGDWDVSGTVDFVDKQLDLKIGLYLSRENSKDLDLLGGLLQDDKGRVKINFSLGGSYDNPTVTNISTDNDLLMKKIEKNIKEKARDLLKGLFKK